LPPYYPPQPEETAENPCCIELPTGEIYCPKSEECIDKILSQGIKPPESLE